ncbi:MAG: DUF2203 domain-containing protein [Anaerolineales bacterium]
MPPRYFSLEQANAALTIIRPIMDEVQFIRLEILSTQADVWPVIQKALGNGGSRAASRMAHNFDRLDKLVHQILDTGAILKDINTGLLDFPALRDNHEVYLCWQHGEQRIGYWHEIDAGFEGRQPLDTF